MKFFITTIFFSIVLGISFTQEISTEESYLLFSTTTSNAGRGDVNVVNTNNNRILDLAANPSLYAGLEKGFYFNFSYLPLFRDTYATKPRRSKMSSEIFVTDFNISYAFNKKHTLSYSNRVFKMGQVFSTINPYVRSEKPYSLTQAIRYSTLFGDKFGLGVSFNYSFTNYKSLNGGASPFIHAIGTSIGFDYRNTYPIKETLDYKINTGLAIMNFGKRINFQHLLPVQLNMGLENAIVVKNIKLHHTVSLAYQLSKPMLPTQGGKNAPNTYSVYGSYPSFGKQVFGSFADSPNGAKGEFKEFDHSIGLSYELLWKKQLRMETSIGSFIEAVSYGRRHLTWSTGIGYKGFNIGFAYLHALGNNTFLNKTYRVTFAFTINTDKDKPKLGFE